MDFSALQIPMDGFLKMICQQAKIGCWVIDFTNNYHLWFSDSYCNMLGIENKNEVQLLEDFLDNTVHPDDRHLVVATIRNYVSRLAASDNHEVRLKNRNGHYNRYLTFSEAKCDESNNLQYAIGCIVNIDEKKTFEEESKRLQFFLDVIDEAAGIGMFETNFETGERYWTKQMFDIFELPLETNVNTLAVENFYDKKDYLTFDKSLTKLRIYKKPFDLELRLITAKQNTCWVRITAKPVINKEDAVCGIRGSIQKIEAQKLKENFLIDIRDRIREQKFFLDETSAMADVGGWELDLENNTLFWTEQTKKIYGVDYVPHFDETMQFYSADSQTMLSESLVKLIDKGEPYDLQLKLTTANSRNIWVRTLGKPVYHLGKIIKVRGVIQNITEQKQKELDLSEALNIINGQNSKLKDFTYIVSHNLRSHAGNLKMITEMVELENDSTLKLYWIDLIKNVSSSLGETVDNLNGLVNLNTENKRWLSFTQTFSNVTKALAFNLASDEVQITTDFTKCDYINYVPAYLESIMLNLITNAIKYKHPERKAVIELCTDKENESISLQVKDNGLGIDLAKYGNQLFKMNQTFHQNADARGIGLYITKNQIESLGGNIEVDSVVNKGTTFTIRF